MPAAFYAGAHFDRVEKNGTASLIVQGKDRTGIVFA